MTEKLRIPSRHPTPTDSDAVVFSVRLYGKPLGELGLPDQDLSQLKWKDFKTYLLQNFLTIEDHDDICITYSDEDGDQVPIASEDEYQEALKVAKKKTESKEKLVLEVSREGVYSPNSIITFMQSSMKRVASSPSSDANMKKTSTTSSSPGAESTINIIGTSSPYTNMKRDNNTTTTQSDPAIERVASPRTLDSNKKHVINQSSPIHRMVGFTLKPYCPYPRKQSRGDKGESSNSRVPKLSTLAERKNKYTNTIKSVNVQPTSTNKVEITRKVVNNNNDAWWEARLKHMQRRMKHFEPYSSNLNYSTGSHYKEDKVFEIGRAIDTGYYTPPLFTPRLSSAETFVDLYPPPNEVLIGNESSSSSSGSDSSSNSSANYDNTREHSYFYNKCRRISSIPSYVDTNFKKNSLSNSDVDTNFKRSTHSISDDPCKHSRMDYKVSNNFHKTSSDSTRNAAADVPQNDWFIPPDNIKSCPSYCMHYADKSPNDDLWSGGKYKHPPKWFCSHMDKYYQHRLSSLTRKFEGIVQKSLKKQEDDICKFITTVLHETKSKHKCKTVQAEEKKFRKNCRELYDTIGSLSLLSDEEEDEEKGREKENKEEENEEEEWKKNKEEEEGKKNKEKERKKNKKEENDDDVKNVMKRKNASLGGNVELKTKQARDDILKNKLLLKDNKEKVSNTASNSSSNNTNNDNNSNNTPLNAIKEKVVKISDKTKGEVSVKAKTKSSIELQRESLVEAKLRLKTAERQKKAADKLKKLMVKSEKVKAKEEERLKRKTSKETEKVKKKSERSDRKMSGFTRANEGSPKGSWSEDKMLASIEGLRKRQTYSTEEVHRLRKIVDKHHSRFNKLDSITDQHKKISSKYKKFSIDTNSMPMNRELLAKALADLEKLAEEKSDTLTLGYEATFLKDVTYPDGAQVVPGRCFTKVWKVTNTGTIRWNSRTKFCKWSQVKFKGSPASWKLRPCHTLISCPALKPGETADIIVQFTAPLQPGLFATHWRFCQSGRVFGNQMWCTVQVIHTAPAVYYYPEPPMNNHHHECCGSRIFPDFNTGPIGPHNHGSGYATRRELPITFENDLPNDERIFTEGADRADRFINLYNRSDDNEEDIPCRPNSCNGPCQVIPSLPKNEYEQLLRVARKPLPSRSREYDDMVLSKMGHYFPTDKKVKANVTKEHPLCDTRDDDFLVTSFDFPSSEDENSDSYEDAAVEISSNDKQSEEEIKKAEQLQYDEKRKEIQDIREFHKARKAVINEELFETAMARREKIYDEDRAKHVAKIRQLYEAELAKQSAKSKHQPCEAKEDDHVNNPQIQETDNVSEEQLHHEVSKDKLEENCIVKEQAKPILHHEEKCVDYLQCEKINNDNGNDQVADIAAAAPINKNSTKVNVTDLISFEEEVNGSKIDNHNLEDYVYNSDDNHSSSSSSSCSSYSSDENNDKVATKTDTTTNCTLPAMVLSSSSSSCHHTTTGSFATPADATTKEEPTSVTTTSTQSSSLDTNNSMTMDTNNRIEVIKSSPKDGISIPKVNSTDTTTLMEGSSNALDSLTTITKSLDVLSLSTLSSGTCSELDSEDEAILNESDSDSSNSSEYCIVNLPECFQLENGNNGDDVEDASKQDIPVVETPDYLSAGEDDVDTLALPFRCLEETSEVPKCIGTYYNANLPPIPTPIPSSNCLSTASLLFNCARRRQPRFSSTKNQTKRSTSIVDISVELKDIIPDLEVEVELGMHVIPPVKSIPELRSMYKPILAKLWLCRCKDDDYDQLMATHNVSELMLKLYNLLDEQQRNKFFETLFPLYMHVKMMILPKIEDESLHPVIRDYTLLSHVINFHLYHWKVIKDYTEDDKGINTLPAKSLFQVDDAWKSSLYLGTTQHIVSKQPECTTVPLTNTCDNTSNDNKSDGQPTVIFCSSSDTNNPPSIVPPTTTSTTTTGGQVYTDIVGALPDEVVRIIPEDLMRGAWNTAVSFLSRINQEVLSPDSSSSSSSERALTRELINNVASLRNSRENSHNTPSSDAQTSNASNNTENTSADIAASLPEAAAAAATAPATTSTNYQAEAAPPPLSPAMKQLEDMGFTDRGSNHRLLIKHHNDVSNAVAELIVLHNL